MKGGIDMRATEFNVEVTDSENHRANTIMDIRVTHNGHQWWTTWLDIDEWPEVVAAVDAYLAKRENGG